MLVVHLCMSLRAVCVIPNTKGYLSFETLLVPFCFIVFVCSFLNSNPLDGARQKEGQQCSTPLPWLAAFVVLFFSFSIVAVPGFMPLFYCTLNDWFTRCFDSYSYVHRSDHFFVPISYFAPTRLNASNDAGEGD